MAIHTRTAREQIPARTTGPSGARTSYPRTRIAIPSAARQARTRSAPAWAPPPAAARAAAGTVAGPVGTIAGAAIGAVVGGLAGKGVAEMIDPTAEEAYWRENYEREPYYERGHTYATTIPVPRGLGRPRALRRRTFDEVERELRADYERNRGKSRLEWEKTGTPRARRGTASTYRRLERS